MFLQFQFLHGFSLSRHTVMCYLWALKQVFTRIIRLTLFSLFVFLLCLVLLWHVYSGWSIPIFSNWWMSSRPKRSTSSSLNCEFRCLMSWRERLPACLCSYSGLLNSMCWLYIHGERAVVAWGLVDIRTALNATHLVFRYDCLLAALFSSACVLGGLWYIFYGYAKCAIPTLSFEDTWFMDLGILVRMTMINTRGTSLGK